MSRDIYIVTVGEYSDYHIAEVFSDFDEAEKFAELHSKGKYNDEYYVETYTIDRVKYEEPEKYIEYFEVLFTIDGKVKNISKEYDNFYTPAPISTRVDVTIKVIADDEEHALKIARDKFAKYKYEKECFE